MPKIPKEKQTGFLEMESAETKAVSIIYL